MTDRPYTDADLRAEAARQHQTATEDPDFMGIAEQMEGAFIESTLVDPDPQTGTEPVTGRTWDELDEDSYDAAQRSIDDLIGKAADVSEWAINLGADGLEPTGHTFQLGSQGLGEDDEEQPGVRLHFAFHPEWDDDVRDQFVMRLTRLIAQNL
jgi:hypothetical protein